VIICKRVTKHVRVSLEQDAHLKIHQASKFDSKHTHTHVHTLAHGVGVSVCDGHTHSTSGLAYQGDTWERSLRGGRRGTCQDWGFHGSLIGLARTIYIRCVYGIWAEIYRIYGHIRHKYTVLANL